MTHTHAIPLPDGSKLIPYGLDRWILRVARKNGSLCDRAAWNVDCASSEIPTLLDRHFKHTTKGDLIRWAFGDNADKVDTAIPIDLWKTVDLRWCVSDYTNGRYQVTDLREKLRETYPFFADVVLGGNR